VSPTVNQATRPQSIGILGGSFDPVHKGHIGIAKAAIKQLKLDQLRFLPCHIPPHKTQLKSTSAQRIAMLELAIGRKPYMHIDTREMRRTEPSYTLKTLQSFRQEFGSACQLNFIMGWDSWQSFHTWYHWQSFLPLANLVIINRPGYSQAVGDDQQQLQQQWLIPAEQLVDFSSGRVCYLHAPEQNISSSEIRQCVGARQAPNKASGDLTENLIDNLVDNLVGIDIAKFIENAGLYR